MEGNKFKEQINSIMEEHSMWVQDEKTGLRVCFNKDCNAVISENGIPTPEARLSHQIDKLLEAGFTMIEPEKDRFGSDEGQTIESPGMVRWFNDSHYFLKRIGNMWDGIRKPNTFVLGLENRYGDGAYSFSTSIEFDNDEAPDLMDRIAKFNELPTYTELQEKLDKARADLEMFKSETGAAIFSDEISKSKVHQRLNWILKGME